MTLKSILLPATVCVARCVDDYRHIGKLDSRLTVDGKSYPMERQIGNETILDTGADPQFWVSIGAFRYDCKSTRASGCARVVRIVEPRLTADAPN
ncbi:MAG: hypothetical protein GDA40_06595 [Rhodobacteraceae bacterium]|nr:hypothetical protein [Paracoccaceae bacterium]